MNEICSEFENLDYFYCNGYIKFYVILGRGYYCLKLG